MKTISIEEFKKRYGEVGLSQFSQPKGQSVGGFVKNTVSSAFKSGVSQANQGIQQVGRGKSPLDLVEGFGRFGAGAIGAAFAPLAPLFHPVGKALEGVANTISDIPAVQKFADTKAGQITSRVAENVANYSNIAQAVGGSKFLMKKFGGVEAPIEASLPEPPGPDAPGPSMLDNLNNKAVNYFGKQIKSDWERPALTPNASYSKAAQIFKKAEKNGHNIADTLVQNKIEPASVIEGGKYTTLDTAEKIRADAARTSHDMLHPSLREADRFTAKTPVENIIKTAVERVKSNTKITPGNKTTVVKALQDELQSLKGEYKEGMSLTDLLDNRITYDLNAKYSPVGDVGTNNIAIKNKAIADSMRTLLEKNTPSGIPMKAFQAEIRKQFQAANYLEALNNKKVPMTVQSRIAQTAAKVTGAAVGHGMGGGILGGVGGYHLGGVIESMFENLPNPFKRQFLENLKVTNPEAFTAIKEFLQNQMTQDANTLALPEGSTIFGQSKTPPQGSSMQIKTAPKGLPGRDPKTGRLFRTYKSTLD